MYAQIILTGVSETEKAAREILEHIEAIKEIQRRASWSGTSVQVVLENKEEAVSGN